MYHDRRTKARNLETDLCENLVGARELGEKFNEVNSNDV